MSTDRVTLEALSRHTKKELRYFELISLRFEGRTDQIFVCIGKHALHLVKRNLAGMYLGDKGGELFYAHIEKLVEDEQSDTDMLLVMNENRPSQWPSANIFIVAENRNRLVEFLVVAWQTDHAWRKGRIKNLPRSLQPLHKRPQASVQSLLPYKEYQKVCHQGYYIFLPNSYAMKAQRSGTVRTFSDDVREVEVSLRVEEPEPLADIEVTGHDHIRWVATDFRQAVTEDLSEVMILRNSFYLKKMNLANDIACWMGWEVVFKSESCATAAIFFRRQYIPPMLDAAQDISIVLWCPVHTLADGIATEMDLLHEARSIADSLTPTVQDCTQHQTLYRDMIQAKMDALLFNEDALTWLDSVFTLKDHADQGSSLSLRRPNCEIEAWTFLKSIMTVLQEENAMANPEVLNMCPLGLPVLSKPISVCDLVVEKMDGMREQQGGSAAEREHDPVMNAWLARVARFFAHCVDGFLLGKRFTLCDVAGVSIVAQKTRQKIDAAVLFMLHARPRDMTQPFVVTSIKHLLHDPAFPHEYSYNDRVMQSLLELGWISKSLLPPDMEEDAASNTMSIDCAMFLSRLLRQTQSANLKASICRMLISNRGSQVHFAIILPAVMEILNQRSLYLKTYATVTLINLSRGQDGVKNALMREGISWMILDNMKLQDDDLTHYSLVLLTNLTKHVSHRAQFFESSVGLADTLTSLLRSSVSTPSKQQIVAEVSSVVGQLCIDDHGWESFCREGSMTIHILMDTHDEVEVGSKVKSKVMFALKQICSRPEAPKGFPKDLIGQHLIPKVAAELKVVADKVQDLAETHDFDHDCINNAVQLLIVLSVARKNCELMAKENLVEALEDLMASPLCHTEGTKAPGGTSVVRVLPESTCEQLHSLWATLHGKFMGTEALPQTPSASRRRASTIEDLPRQAPKAMPKTSLL